MFGLGMPEVLMILAIALIVIGPKKLPDLAKTLGRAMGEFKRSAQDFKRSIDVESTVKDIKKDIDIPETDLSEFLTDPPANDETAKADGDETVTETHDETSTTPQDETVTATDDETIASEQEKSGVKDHDADVSNHTEDGLPENKDSDKADNASEHDKIDNP
ncbi:twin-arginine translocase TatA/TatE family subunit [Desulfobacula sp.]